MKPRWERTRRWRLRTRKDFALLTAIFAVLGLINLAVFSELTAARAIATVTGVLTGGWIMIRLLKPPNES